MIGDFVARSLALVVGYAYPAYECFKTVELNKPDIDRLVFWCKYWILVATLTVFERVGDNFVSWIPMYGEAKLAFFVYLWYPKTKGTTYVYETFFRPYVSKHENEIDRNLLELRTRAGDIAVLYFQKATSYGQTRFFELLQYVASQSPSQSQSSRPRTVQQRQPLEQARQQPQHVRHTESTPNANQQVAIDQQERPTNNPPTPTKSQSQDTAKIVSAPPAAPVPVPRTSSGLSGQSNSETSSSQASKGEATQVVTENSLDKEDPSPPLEETPMEEAIRVTRGRLRKRVAPDGGGVPTRK